jgi:hypothetical protein
MECLDLCQETERTLCVSILFLLVSSLEMKTLIDTRSMAANVIDEDLMKISTQERKPGWSC